MLAALLLVAAAGFQAPSVRVALASVGGPAVDPPAPAPVPAASSSSPVPRASVPPPPARTPDPAKPSKPTVPAKVDVPEKGTGGYLRAKATHRTERTKGRLIRFDVRVEKGMPFDPEDAARFMAAVLDDDRSWAGSGKWRFELVDDPGEAELHAWIVSPTTTDQKCYPLLTRGQVSCQSGNDVVLNATRWGQGAKAYGDDLVGYRRYLVNHEFGHYLGYQHVGCPGKGKRAPVMMQQTKSVGACRPNSWPDPDRD